MPKKKQFILEHIKGLELGQLELVGKEWEAWIEGRSREEVIAYCLDVIETATSLGHSIEDAKTPGTAIAKKQAELLFYVMTSIWKAYELADLRDSHAALEKEVFES